MIGQFSSPVPGQRRHHPVWQMLHLGNQGAYDTVAILAADLDQHDKPRTAFDQRGDMAVSCTTQQVAFLSAGRRCLHRRKASDRDQHDPRAQRVCPGSTRHR